MWWIASTWHSYTGAVTWGNGNTGITGTVSEVNSLVGSNPGDYVGVYVTPLNNGNYVVGSYEWNAQRGAATWGNGNTGISGTVSDANSLVGGNPGDQVGLGVTPLSNGNYVAATIYWNDTRGAVTWANGRTGGRGTVSAVNSLVGSNLGDYVGIGGVMPLPNGNYVVASGRWNDDRGAATWGDGRTGVSGMISAANSLVGSNPNDQVGYTLAYSPITVLSNGNYVVQSPFWNENRGAATWGNGSTGISGTVSDTNSLVGNYPDDFVGDFVTPLRNGNFVVASDGWNDYRGAVTWGDGNAGIRGTVSNVNSLVGSNPGDRFGNGGDQVGSGGITPLANGNYVIDSPGWNGARGAVAWGDGRTGISGTVSASNSLIGSDPNDYVGAYVTPLNNGNYVVASYAWNAQRGAVTWGNGNTGISGTVSAANSLVGGNPGDQVGLGITPLSNGNYVVSSPHRNGNIGAGTWVSGTSGQTFDGLGMITPQNSIVGSTPNPSGKLNIIDDPTAQTFLVALPSAGGGQVIAGLSKPGELPYAIAESQTVTITPALLNGILDTGTAVVLRASNDIKVNDPITVSAGGNGGALTLQAGRSIILNASISTDNGALTLIANDQLANGVVDAERDPGSAVISMAPGTLLDTGSGPLTIELSDGAGLTNADSGAITLQSVSASSVAVVNDGLSAGSDVDLGSVTTSGVQSYADPNGITTVSGNLTAANPITFDDSVVLNAGVSIDADFGTVNFAGSGLQQLTSGTGATLGNVLHNGTSTLQLTSGLTIQGRFTNQSGTFDANNQPVTVAGLTTVAGRTYLAGTAPQSLDGGLVILAGVFTSSTGPMSVNGGVILTGGYTSFGLLSGVGAVDTLTTLGGVLAPGGNSPGILSVSGTLTLNLYTTVSVLLNGTAAGTGYAQLQAGGPIDLGDSTLNLTFGFVPPVGSSFEIVTNTGSSSPITGTFQGLPDGALFTQGSYQFQITYQGGTGGDSVVLTRLG